MAACNPRKFKDRIALLNQKQQEGEAQFQAVMQEVSQVWKQNSNPGLYKGPLPGQQMMPHQGLGIPNHFSQGFQHPPHFSKYGGSLPNVNQLTATPPAVDVAQVQETPDIGNTLPGLHQFQQGLCHSLPGSHHSSDHISGMEQQRSGQSSPRGSRAIRNRSGDQRWDTSPYRDDRHYSGSLSPYMSPSPQARWRRISSDSALYQSVKAPLQTDIGSPGSDEQPINSSQEEVNKLQINLSGNQFNMKQTHPSPVKGGLYLVKEEAVCPETNNDNKHQIIDLYQNKTPQSPSYNSPMSPSYGSPMSPSYIPTCSSPNSPSSPSLPAQNFQHPTDKSWSNYNQYQHNIEQDFLKFGLGNALDRSMGQKFGYSGGQLVIADQHQQLQNPNQGVPTPSPQTPKKIPQFIITDFSENQKPPDPNNRYSPKHQNNRQVGIFPFFDDSQTDENGLDSDFSVDQLRQDLEPIDDQMLAILTGTGVAEPDLEVEQHFKN